MAGERASATKPPAIFLAGPTASGKTGAAITLARELRVALINVDSAQVYRGMDIGTAKPEPVLRERYPHRLMDVLDPAERYSAAQFREDALREMAAITRAGKVPLLVGGTGLYFRALERGLADLPPANLAIRAEIEAAAARRGWAAMHAELAEVDPESASRISPNDPQRIQRALEVFRLTGRPLHAHWQEDSATAFPYRVLKVALTTERSELYRRIEERFRAMMEAGFLDEVRELKSRGNLEPDMPSMRAVGYRQLWEHLAGECGLDEAVRQAIVASRRYAKRQMTWFRGDAAFEWFDSADADLERRLLERTKCFIVGE